MSESSNSWPVEDGDWANFDLKKFVRNTIFAIESADEYDHVDQLRLTRVEECIAARWPRRSLLWSRLRCEIRASVATWNDAYIPRSDFYGRGVEWAGQQSMALMLRGRRAERQAKDDAAQAAETGQQQPPAEGGAGPGEGFLT